MSWERSAFPVSSFKGFQLKVWLKHSVAPGGELPGERVFSTDVQASGVLTSCAHVCVQQGWAVAVVGLRSSICR